MLLLTILLALTCAGLAIEVFRLRAELDEMRWIQDKVFPLMLEVAGEDPDSQEYLDPDSLRAYTRGEITLDEVSTLKPESKAIPQP